MCLSSPPNYQVGDPIYRPTKFNSPGWAGGGRASCKLAGGRWACGLGDGQRLARRAGGRAGGRWTGAVVVQQVHTYLIKLRDAGITCRQQCYRPLSQRVDRCDRLIQNESIETQTAVMCVCFQQRRARHNANYVPYAQIRFDLYVRELLASLSIAMAFSR